MAETSYRPRFGAPRDAKPQPSKRLDRGSMITAAFNYVVTDHVRATLFLIVCGLFFFLPGFFSIPAIDRDEARFAQATKQMVETSDFVDIRFQDEVRYKKPVGIYWLQAAAVETASALGLPGAQIRIWLYRLPSLGGAIGAVLLTYWTALAFVTRRAAVIAALILCSSILLGVEARLAKTDAMLLMCVVAMMGAMGRIYTQWQRGDDPVRADWRVPLIFWVAMAVGILIKGPLMLMFAGLTIASLAILDRNVGWLKRLQPLWGIPLLLSFAVPWFIAIYLRAGDAFFADSLGGDMLNKVARGQESHGAPPGAYFLLFWLTFWPGTAVVAMAAPAVWRARREPGAQYLLAWLIPSWIVFELVMTKLPHYVLPLYPALAILAAGALERRVLSRGWLSWSAAWWFIVPAGIAVALVVLGVTLVRHPLFAAWPALAASMIFALFAWRLYDDYRAERSQLHALVSALFLSIATYGFVFPALSPLFVSTEIARTLRNVVCVGPKAASAGFHEPSLVFMVGTETLLTDGSGAADFLSQGTCRFALVEARSERAFAQRADSIGLRYNMGASGRIEGYNYSNGKYVSIAVFRSEGTE